MVKKPDNLEDCMAPSLSPRTILLMALLFFSVFFAKSSGSRVGVCYGTLGNNLPTPAEVVDHYKYHKIDKMRLYWPDPRALAALRDSGIEVILDVSPQDLQTFATSPDKAGDWVGRNIVNNWPSIKFKYIAVGNEIIPRSGSQNVLPAMKNIYNAVAAAGLQNSIKVSTVVDTGVIGVSYPPSAGAFSSGAAQYMGPIVKFLAGINSPLLCNVYPYFSYAGNSRQISLEYALFRAPGTVVRDGQYEYQNLFDAQVDSVYAAMEKVGGSSVGLVISETGWPWNGGFGASLDNAGSYNWNVINHVGKGTPRRPRPLETYLFAMFNENQKGGPEIEKYFGLFYPDRKPVYPLDF